MMQHLESGCPASPDACPARVPDTEDREKRWINASDRDFTRLPSTPMRPDHFKCHRLVLLMVAEPSSRGMTDSPRFQR